LIQFVTFRRTTVEWAVYFSLFSVYKLKRVCVWSATKLSMKLKIRRAITNLVNILMPTGQRDVPTV
jgi:hypothetical protein